MPVLFLIEWKYKKKKVGGSHATAVSLRCALAISSSLLSLHAMSFLLFVNPCSILWPDPIPSSILTFFSVSLSHPCSVCLTPLHLQALRNPAVATKIPFHPRTSQQYIFGSLTHPTHSLQLSATDQFKPPISDQAFLYQLPLLPSHWDYPLKRH